MKDRNKWKRYLAGILSMVMIMTTAIGNISIAADTDTPADINIEAAEEVTEPAAEEVTKPAAEEATEPAAEAAEEKSEEGESADETEKVSSAYAQKYSDDQVEINVTADAGVVPEGAALSVTPIIKQDVTDDLDLEKKEKIEALNQKYDETEKHLEEKFEEDDEQKTLEAFLAYDISFYVDGAEVEPNGSVEVKMDFVKAVLPEGATENSEVTLNHLEKDETAESGIKVVDITENAAVETAEEEPAVKKVEWTADSFSTFTLVWGSGQNNSLTVKCVDAATREDVPVNLYGNDTMVVDGGGVVYIAKDADRLSNEIYTFKDAKIGDAETGASLETIKYEDSQWWYTSTGNTAWQKIDEWNKELANRIVYVLYESPKGTTLNTVDTVDSKSAGIDIQMFDYKDSTPSASWGPYTNANNVQGKLSQGLVEDELNSDGIPVIKAATGVKSEAMNASFNPKYNNGTNYRGQANNLFLKSEYDETGSYYYNSYKNFAQYDQSTGKFTVYDALATPSNNNNFFYQRGNFLPYNKLTLGLFSTNKNLYDENGVLLGADDEARNQPLYLIEEKAVNYQFGMAITANFMQPNNGKYRNQDMIYEFNGDDDMWVFIDGVLVLDLGGIHDAQSGSINFATGVVEWTDIAKADVGSNKPIVKQSTTIKAQFEGTSKADTQWRGNTFANNTGHIIKIFYMERGRGASDCKIKFNLPVIEQDSVVVSKQIVAEDGVVDLEQKFDMQLKDGKGNPVAGKAYKVFRDGAETDSGITTTEGGFQLASNEYAVISGMNLDADYQVSEVGIDRTVYDKVQVGNTTSENLDATTITSGVYNVSQNKTVNVINYKKSSGKQNTPTFHTAKTATATDQTIEIAKALKTGESYPEDKDRTYQITMSAYADNVEGVVNSAVPLDVVLVLDAGQALTENGLVQLKEGVDEFVDKLNNVAPGSRIGIIDANQNNGSIDLTSGEYCSANEQNDTLHDLISQVQINTKDEQSNLNQALQQAEKYCNQTGSNEKITIIISDGNNIERETAQSATDIYSAGSKIYCVSTGVATSPGNISLGALVRPGSDENYYLGGYGVEYLNRALTRVLSNYNIVSFQADVKDYLDSRFEFILSKDDSTKLEALGSSIKNPSGYTGATIGHDDGGYYIFWEDLTIGDQKNKWKETIEVKAKDTFIGGNEITTNGDGSGVYYTKTLTEPFPQPQVNVPARFKVNNAEATIFIEENIPSTLENDKNVQNLIYTPDAKIWCGGAETGAFEYIWKEKGKDGVIAQGNAEQARTQLAAYFKEDKNKPEQDIVYTCEVKFIPNQQATTVDGGRAVARDVADSGQYTVKVVHGTIKVTKKVRKSDIDLNQGNPTFTLKITNENNKSWYKTAEFTGASVKNISDEYAQITVIFENLPRGVYKVGEESTLRYEQDGYTTLTADPTNGFPASIIATSEEICIGYKTSGGIDNNARDAAAAITNKKTYGDYTSDTDVVTNHFTMEDGEVTITPEKTTTIKG